MTLSKIVHSSSARRRKTERDEFFGDICQIQVEAIHLKNSVVKISMATEIILSGQH